MIAESPRDHLRESHQHRVESVGFSGIHGEGVLMADGFRIATFADLGVEPAACVKSARLACQSQSPFAEMLFEERFFQCGEITHFPDAASVQITFGYFADAGD